MSRTGQQLTAVTPVIEAAPWPCQQKSPRPQLGLVCITATNEVRFRTITRKRLLQLSVLEQQQILKELYGDNLQRLDTALDYCVAHNIRLYRMNSALFPFADVSPGTIVLAQLQDALRQVGDRATALGIRLVLHPEQFVVLSSDKPEVVENSVKILQTQAQILDGLGQPRSPWAVMEIHGGKADRAARLVQVIRNLPEAIRSRLALENDEHAYSAWEIFEVCQATGVPMVFDAHHHVCHEGLTSYDDPSVAEMVAVARTTWPIPEWQLVHISNGREFFADPHHSDLITAMPSAYCEVPWIEVEAKHKELAIAKLRAEWLQDT